MTKKKEGKPKNERVNYASIILDTSSELEILLNRYVFEVVASRSTKERERLSPNEYTMRNMYMSAIFNSPIEAGMNLITLQYMKPEWKTDSKGQLYETGEKVIDGWRRTEGQADVNMTAENLQITIVSNWADPKYNGKVFKGEDDIETVAATLLEGIYDLDEEFPCLIYSITGDAKQGKTHFAYTAPEPIKVFAFNRGAEFLKRKFPKKHIDVSTYLVPVVEPNEDTPWATPIFEPFYKEFKKVIGG